MRMTVIYPLTALLVTTAAYGITDPERAALSRLRLELESMSTIVDEAEQQAIPHDRESVRYQRLRDDLEKVLQGVDDAKNAERREPRSLPPIDGDYR